MNWGALIGAFIGAAIPAFLTYAKLRGDRQAVDAEVLGPALLLLEELDPLRVTMNIADAGREAERWKDLNQKVDTVRSGLLVMSARHPRAEIRRYAREAQVKLANVRQASGWAVQDPRSAR